MEDTEVWRMRRMFPKEFHCLVKMHLSFLLDLSTDDCDCSFVYDTHPQMSPPSTHRHKDLAKKFLPTPRKSSTGVNNTFKGVMEGLPLTMEGVCQIYQLIQFLGRSTDHLRVEGLFRKHGNLKKQQALRERLNRGIPIDLEDGEFTVHEVASVVKMFLSELPEPLLTDACYRAHCQVASMTDRDKQIHALQLLFLLIPDSNYQLLKDTLQLLHATAQEEESNKMSASNLATVFATHLLCPRKLSVEILQSNHQLFIKAITVMIEESTKLFGTVPVHLAKDVAAHFRRQDDETSKLLDPPPQFSSVHRVQTRRQAISLQRSQSVNVSDSPTRLQSPIVNTIFSFVDRKTTQALNEKSTTATELAKLYAHVQSMPESAQKKKLVQKLNDANGIGTPSRKIKSKTQKTKNQLKNFLTPRGVKGSKISRDVAEPGDEKKGWHTNSYNVAQVITSEQRPPSSAMSSFKRRSSEDRQMATPTFNVEIVSPVKPSDETDVDRVLVCPRGTLDFDVEEDTESQSSSNQDEAQTLAGKKLPPPPVPPRISSLTASIAPSPLSRKVSASRNRKPLIVISNSLLTTPESQNKEKNSPVRWDSGYLSQKMDDPILPPSPQPQDQTTSEIIDVDEMLEKMEKDDELDDSVQSEDDESGWPPSKTIRLTPPNDSSSCSSFNDSVTSSVIREEAEQLLRGDFDPSDSMCAFLDGEVETNESPEVTPERNLPPTSSSKKMGRKRSITELGGPNAMAKTSTPTGIYFETDL